MQTKRKDRGTEADVDRRSAALLFPELVTWRVARILVIRARSARGGFRERRRGCGVVVRRAGAGRFVRRSGNSPLTLPSPPGEWRGNGGGNREISRPRRNRTDRERPGGPGNWLPGSEGQEGGRLPSGYPSCASRTANNLAVSPGNQKPAPSPGGCFTVWIKFGILCAGS